MANPLAVDILGIDGIRRTLGVMASAFDAASMVKINESIIRPTPAPGTSQPIMRAAFTLEMQARIAFENEGRTVLNAGWQGYSREPKYFAMKKARGAGSKVGIWAGSTRPLFATFEKGHRQNISKIDARGFIWGSKRAYAGRFHEGGYQRWDDIIHPGRPIVVVNREFGREVARAYQRWLSFKMKAAGGGIDNLRVNL